MKPSKRLRFVCAPGFAGGRLQVWNKTLRLLLAVPHLGEEWQAQLVFDPQRVTRADFELHLLNQCGDPVRIPAPPDGVFAHESQRHEYSTRIQELCPLGTTSQSLLAQLLPRPQENLIQAAIRLFQERFGPLGLSVLSQADCSQADEVVEIFDGGPEITWLSGRHLLALEQLGLEPQVGILGEAHLRMAATPQEGNPSLDILGALESSLADHTQALQRGVAEQEPRLQGAWLRLRRESRRASAKFRRAAARTLRNRDGIRGKQLHALAQSLRPRDGQQQDGLSLLFAAGAFGLDLERTKDALKALAAIDPQASALVSCVDFCSYP